MERVLMATRKSCLRVRFMLVLGMIGCVFPARAQFDRESVLRISNYSPQLVDIDTVNGIKTIYDAQEQNFGIAQDKRGLMYFANNEGVLEYDGARWNKIVVGSDLQVFSVGRGKDGQIYVGSKSELGFLKPDADGQLRYESLLRYVPEEERDFNEVWRVLLCSAGVIFQSPEKIFLWNGHDMKVWNAATGFYKAFVYGNEVYVIQHDMGVFVLHGDVLKPLWHDARFDHSLESLAPYDSNHMLLATKNSEFFLVNTQDSSVAPFPCQASEALRMSRVYNILPLGDRYFSVGTFGDGLVIINRKGEVLTSINKSIGLQDQLIYAQYLDDSNNLWLALSKGIARVDIHDPISFFNDRNGLQGAVQSIGRFRGQLYVGTLYGLYVLNGQDDLSMLDQEEAQAHFSPVNEVINECWGLLPVHRGKQSVMLMAMNNDVLQMDANGDVDSILRVEPYVLYPSRTDSNRVYLGLTKGLQSIYLTSNGWKDEGQVPGIDQVVFSVNEDADGNLWLGTMREGVIRISDIRFGQKGMDHPTITRFGHKSGLEYEDEPILVEQIGKRLYFASYSGVFEFNPHNNTFERSLVLGPWFYKPENGDTLGIHRMKEGPNGDVWVVGVHKNREKIEVGYVIPRNGKNAKWIKGPFSTISNKIIHSIFHDPHGVTWLGGVEGLFRYDAKMEKDYQKPYPAMIRRVSMVKGKDVFLGTNYDENGELVNVQTESMIPVIPFGENALKFEFAAPQYGQEEGVVYQYLLTGADKGWSDWGQESHKEYSYIGEGTHRFRVRAKNIYGVVSEEAVYEFVVLPPWYRTFWAYIAYVLAFATFVYGAVTISTKSLRNVIRERTMEVVKQKELVEEKNRDILDSIRYAKRIQEAILPPNDSVKQLLPDSFVLYKPKDIVSGDFYYIRGQADEKGDEKVIFAAVDCTGHGVPGAFMSIVGHNSLNQAVTVKGMTRPGEVLNYINHLMTESLGQERSNSTVHDGMDIALCSLDRKRMKLQYAGAFNPLYIIRKGKLIETKADKHPVGGYKDDEAMHFTNHEFDLLRGDCIYVFSDGFADQFGGPEGKKFKYQTFRNLLISIHETAMNAQGAYLDQTLTAWMSGYEQVDDICVIGVRV
ncbi:MAG: SpoIIE family protein phosphatase [Flavobacteriales bacterium]|nr:SpoIIE family protein phosphatase [Flavobacteriales bacterium]MCB9447918.1 SpoIIE family protein phosphatase [Flavobacteriales bacterium]